MGCKYCTTSNKLNSIADSWLVDKEITTFPKGPIMHGACINVENKTLELNVGPKFGDDYGISEISVVEVPIKYCPICGREL